MTKLYNIETQSFSKRSHLLGGASYEEGNKLFHWGGVIEKFEVLLRNFVHQNQEVQLL